MSKKGQSLEHNRIKRYLLGIRIQ